MARLAAAPGGDNAGQEKTIKVGEAQSILRIVADRPSDCATLLLYREDDGAVVAPTNTTVDTPIVVVVSFGSGGAGPTVEVDLENGVSFTVPADAVKVQARYELDADAPAPLTPNQRVGAVLYAAPRPGSVRPTRTFRLPSLADGDDVAVQIPKFAATVAVNVDLIAAYGGNLVVDFQRAPAGRRLAQVEIRSTATERIPAGSRSILLQNRTGAAVKATVRFELFL